MKICFPVTESAGLESRLYGHFGSAPVFVVADTDTGEVAEITNSDAHHEHGKCSPLKALGGTKVDAVVVGGIGKGALGKLNASGIRVFRGQADDTVSACLEQYKKGALQEFNPIFVCAGHGAGGGCAHH